MERTNEYGALEPTEAAVRAYDFAPTPDDAFRVIGRIATAVLFDTGPRPAPTRARRDRSEAFLRYFAGPSASAAKRTRVRAYVGGYDATGDAYWNARD